MFRGRGLNISAMAPAAMDQIFTEVSPGQLLVKDTRLFVGCGNGTAIELLQLQPEGKRKIWAHDFIHGYKPKTGEMLGS